MAVTDVQPLLDRVADELRTHGWCQKAAEDPEGRHCLLGAIQALEDLDERDDAYNAVLRRIGPDLAITRWNDAPSRTVLALLAPR